MQTRTEELWNAISHGIGVILSLVGLFVLLYFNTEKTPYSTPGIIVYGFTLVMLYAASTIYHITKDEKKKKFWRKLDHISIYLLIAGTYTPVALIMLEKSAGWTIFYIVWVVAVLGTVLKIFFTGKYEVISVLFYLITGWAILLDLPGLMTNASCFGVFLVFFGGALYTIGVLFYMMEKIPYNHVIWHFLVLGGSISHFFFILLEVI